MNVRKKLETELKPVLPKRWKIVRSVRNIDRPTAITVQFNQTGHRQGPTLGTVISLLDLIVIHPGIDLDRAEDELDDACDTLALQLDEYPWLLCTGSDKQQVQIDQNTALIAYAFHLEIVTQKGAS